MVVNRLECSCQLIKLFEVIILNTVPAMAERIELWPISKLKPYAKNARTHSPEQVNKIVASMVEFGFTNPILVDSNDGIIAGHGRLMAAEKLQLEKAPVIVLDHLTEAQKRAYIIADNRLAEDAGWDLDLLSEELSDLNDIGFDLNLTGFTPEEIDDLLPEIDGEETSPKTDDPDDVPDIEENYTSQEGDIWRLGSHRVMCGDSTNLQDIKKLLEDETVDVTWTDPPYNVNYEGTAGKIQNDHMEASAFGKFLRAVYDVAFSVMREGAPIYVAHADTEGLAFRREFQAAGFKLSSCLIWRKNSLVLGRSDYQWMHEPILYGWKPGAAHTWYGERNKTTMQELELVGVERVDENEWHINLGERVIVVKGEAELQLHNGSIFLEEKPKRNGEHPTMKPVALIERQLKNSAKRNAVVLDLFGGSGSTLMASERLGMKARLNELDPRFVDVIIRRWQDYTGRTAVHHGTGQTFAELTEIRGAGQR